MAINLSQSDTAVLKQSIINRYLKVNILDFQYRIVNEISGNISSFSIAVDANSDIRRTCDVNIVVTGSSFDINSGSQIWLDKFIQPYVGIQNIQTGEIQWYNQGIYLINNPSWSYNASTNSLSFTAVDLMAKMTGLRNGSLTGMTYEVPQGSNVRDAIISTIKLAGFNKYLVEECKTNNGAVQSVPYDIKVEQGGTVYDLLTQLRDILPQYQMFFDVDGVFHYEYIPTGEDAPIIIDDTLWTQILSGESITTDFESVKNVVEVYGNSSLTTQPHATASDTNPDSPFYTGGSVGTIRIVLYGGDYENITTNNLAQQRADLELYWRCRMNDTIELSCLPIPWLDANMVISHAPKGSTVQNRYMVKSFTATYSETGSITINAMSLYAYYPPY